MVAVAPTLFRWSLASNDELIEKHEYICIRNTIIFRFKYLAINDLY